MDAIQLAYAALADLNLWMKIQAGETLSLADVPALIPSQHANILDNWSIVRERILSNATDSETNSDLFNEILLFDNYVLIFQTSIVKKIDVNKLLSKYFNLFDNVSTKEFTLSPREQQTLDTEKQRVSGFNKKNFITLRDQIVAGADLVADRTGGTDATYNSIYGRSAVAANTSRSLSTTSAIYQFRSALHSIEAVLANEQILKGSASIDPFGYARSLSNNPDFDIGSYSSGKLVRLNYGESLQTLALRTLGSEDKWYDIAIANGLKNPYIDEIGQSIPLISNGAGNQINIAALFGSQITKEMFYVNQLVVLQSDTETMPDQRMISSIRVVPISGDLVLELSGEANLDKYKLADNANVRVYLKNTINSSSYILIPSAEAVPQTSTKELPWFLISKAEDEKRAGVDFGVDDSGDLVFTPTGDIQMAYGVDNALQVLKIMLATVQGSLRRHPEFGIAAVIGNKNPDPNRTRTLIGESISSLVLSDSRFDRLDYLSVEYNKSSGASGYIVKIGVVMAGGGNSVVPISFSIPAP